MLLLYIVAAVILGGGAFMVVRRRRLIDARLREQALSAEVDAIKATARAEAAAALSAAVGSAKEQVLDARHVAQEEALRIERELQRREDDVAKRESAFSAAEQRVIARAAAVNEREQGWKALETKKQHEA